MIDLTQKILSLDKEFALELTNANTVNMEAKREADLHAEHQMEKAYQLFEKQKNSEAIQLVKNIKENRELAIENLQKKMKTFDKEVEIDALVEDLLTMAKDRICR